jgi:hypothetical protein
VLDELVEVGGVHVEPHDVGEGHVGSGQDGPEVVERHLELRGHVARMLGVTVGVHRVLSAANEQPLAPSISWAWSNPRLSDHETGLIDLRSIDRFLLGGC